MQLRERDKKVENINNSVCVQVQFYTNFHMVLKIFPPLAIILILFRTVTASRSVGPLQLSLSKIVRHAHPTEEDSEEEKCFELQ